MYSRIRRWPSHSAPCEARETKLNFVPPKIQIQVQWLLIFSPASDTPQHRSCEFQWPPCDSRFASNALRTLPLHRKCIFHPLPPTSNKLELAREPFQREGFHPEGEEAFPAR